MHVFPSNKANVLHEFRQCEYECGIVNANVSVIVSSILSVSACYHNCVNVELFE